MLEAKPLALVATAVLLVALDRGCGLCAAALPQEEEAPHYGNLNGGFNRFLRPVLGHVNRRLGVVYGRTNCGDEQRLYDLQRPFTSG